VTRSAEPIARRRLRAATLPLAWVPVWNGHAGVMRWYHEAR
jgi:hypothetical protein